MRETGGLHVGNSALNITSMSTARAGYTDRTEAGDRKWHRDGSGFHSGAMPRHCRWYCAPENYYGPNPDDASHVLRSAPLRSARLRFLNRVSVMPLICASLSLGE